MSEANHYVSLKPIDEYYDNWDEITIYTDEYACRGIVADVDGLEVLYATDNYNDGTHGSGGMTYFSCPYDYIIPVEVCTTAQSEHVWNPQNEREQKYAQYQYTYYPGSGKYIEPKYKALTFYCECETGWSDPYARVSRFVYPVPEQFNEINESIMQTYKNMPRQGNGSKKTPWTNINWAYLQLCHLWERGDFPSDSKDHSYLFHINLRATGAFDYSLGTFRETMRAYDRSKTYWYHESTPEWMTTEYLPSGTGLRSWIPYNMSWTAWVVLDGSLPNGMEYMALKLDTHNQRTYELHGLPGWDFSIKGLDCSFSQSSVLIDCVVLDGCRIHNIHRLECVVINGCDLSGSVFGGDISLGCFSVTRSLLSYYYDVLHTHEAPYDGSYSEVEKYNASIKGSLPGIIDTTVYARYTAVDCKLFEQSFIMFHDGGQKDVQSAVYRLFAKDVYDGGVKIISYPNFIKTKQVSLSCTLNSGNGAASGDCHLHGLTIEFAPKKFSITDYPYGVSVYVGFGLLLEDLGQIRVDIPITGDEDPNVGEYSCDMRTYWNAPHYHIDINTENLINQAVQDGVWNTLVSATQPVSYGMGDDTWGDGHGRWYWCGPTWDTTEYTITADGVLKNFKQQKMLECDCVMYAD